MMSVDFFVGRQEELKELSILHRKKTASLVVIRGRRRIGKSRLVEEFAKGKNFLAFSGIPPTSGISEQSQRDVFAKQLAKQIGLSSIQSTDWSDLFSVMAKYTEGKQAILLFDEISWMGSLDPTFLGKLKNAWDLELKKNSQLILILCGSVSTWIEENIISSTAFFGRISLNLKLEELSLKNCYDFLNLKGFRGSPLEIFKVLSVTGGIPWYLEQIQSFMNADENIKHLCFKENGVLFNEFEHIFHDLFQKRNNSYREIIEAVADIPLDFNRICEKLKITKSGTLTSYLEDLIAAGFLSRDYTWKIQGGIESSLSHYRLSDNYLRFYLKYVFPYSDQIKRGGFKDRTLSTLPAWNSIMGLQFENLVLKNRKKIWEKLGIKPADIVADNPYFQKKSKTKNGCQIDYLIQTKFNTLFACEIKFSMNLITTATIEEVKEKISNLLLPKRYSCWPVLIHINGVSDGVLDKNYFTEVIDFNAFIEED